jgi:hypothetical protein
MNSKQTTLLIASFLLAFALIANVNNVGNVYATGGLDDEEEEEAIEQLQNSVEELENTIGTIELNLTEGANEIEANCPITEDIVEEVKEVVKNITEQIPTTCPLVPVQNVTEPAVEQNVTCQVVPEPAVEQNVTCQVVPEPAVEQNITEQIEEIIQNVTEDEQPICNIPQDIIPDILPVEEEPVQNNETQQVEVCQVVPEPVQQNETSDLEPIICPVNGELLGYTNTTSGEQLPISAGNQTTTVIEQQEPAEPAAAAAVEQNVTAPLQDEQEIATIEFEASCGCFVVDKTAEEVQ